MITNYLYSNKEIGQVRVKVQRQDMQYFACLLPLIDGHWLDIIVTTERPYVHALRDFLRLSYSAS